MRNSPVDGQWRHQSAAAVPNSQQSAAAGQIFFCFKNIFNANQRLVTLDVREQRPLINVRTMDDACLRVRVIQVRDWPVVRVEGSRLLIGQCQLIFPNLLAAKQRLYGS